MTIRDITQADRETYFRLTADFYESGAALKRVPDEHVENTFAQIIETSPYVRCLLAEEGERILGYALLNFTWSMEAGGKVVWIDELYVSKDARGKGVGEVLVRYVAHEYTGKAKSIRLEVTEENTGAQRLYERLGFSFLPYLQMLKKLSD
ncbi:GNAT family N-acetyltransferase [Oscillospiraceae bacterium OttesenSCG-928-G22]|nr:GNAT family N-acetyltransferase [Oscillospiraceae bacterium OttesenSCG-928-G22]